MLSYLSCAIVCLCFCFLFCFFTFNIQSLGCYIFFNRFVHYVVVLFCQNWSHLHFLFFCRFLPVQPARFKRSIVVVICFFLSSAFVMTFFWGSVIRFVVLPLFLMFSFAHCRRLLFVLVLHSFAPSSGVCFAFLGPHRPVHTYMESPLWYKCTLYPRTPCFPVIAPPHDPLWRPRSSLIVSSFSVYVDTAFHTLLVHFCLCLPCFAVRACTYTPPHP